MTTQLRVTSERSGRVLDTVTLADGLLTYSTGAARDLIEGPRRANPNLTDGRLFELATGWSNGYLTITAAD